MDPKLVETILTQLEIKCKEAFIDKRDFATNREYVDKKMADLQKHLAALNLQTS